MIDVVQQINAVHRTVGDRVLESGEARTVTLSRTYSAEIEDLWDACTTSERLARWFPVSGELRQGGRYRVAGNAEGTILECDPPNGFTATWEYEGQLSWIEVRLTREGEERTRLELEHIAHIDDHWTEFGPGAAGVGWELGLLGLGLHLDSGEGVDPEQAAAWQESAEAVRFMALSSERWGEANAAAGTDPAAAQAAAERTTAFYTGGSADTSAG